MKLNRVSFLIIALNLPVILFSCNGSNGNYQEPILTEFDSLVSSEMLHDSIKNGILVRGMPMYIFKYVMKNWFVETRTVASFGSTQDLVNYGDFGDVYVDPGLKKYLDIYNTPQGLLYVWYGNEDFFSRKLEQNDSLLFFNDDKTIDTSIVGCLEGPRKLTISKSLEKKHVCLLETRQVSNTYKNSYFYNVSINGANINLKTIGMNLYPVYILELDGKIVGSFKYKRAK
jgi:hypothetical protein